MTTANPISLYMAQPSFNSSMADQDVTENYFDFSQCSAQESKPSISPNDIATSSSLSTDPLEGLESFEEYQTPAKPSFAYDEHKQTTGLPLNSLPGIGQQSPSTSPFAQFSNTGLDESSFMDVVDQHPVPSPSPFTPFSNTGLDESSFMGGMDNSFSTSIGMSINPAMVLSGPDSGYNASSSGSMLTPTGYISSPAYSSSPMTPDEARQRVYPGVHMKMAEAQAQQQRMTQQQQLYKQQAMHQQQNLAFRSQTGQTQPSSIDREATITRVINSYRQQPIDANTALAHPPIATHVVRAKKDEEDMDEDEKLLASEEGKKLTSKERRQLRNKVSARAFRSRRKEYISQLEGDLNAKGRECDQLRVRNNQLVAENVAYRRLVSHLVGQPQFESLLQQLSHDPSIGLPQNPSVGQFSTPQMQLPSSSSWAPAPFMSTANPKGRLESIREG